MTRPQLIAKMERDQAAVEKAAASLADLVRLQAEIAQLKRDIADARSKTARANKITMPCPDQAAEIRSLQHRLSKFADYDMDRFKQWCKMVDVAKGKT